MTQATHQNHGLSLFDGRPFFEKALIYGVKNGLIDQQKLNAILSDAPKGIVQIARYFGTEFLRPELELAKVRMVNLMSLHLEHASGGDVHVAAILLRDNSILSRSKAGSDMLKSLIVMPQNTHFGMNESSSFTDKQIPLLSKWTLRDYSDYQTELAKREKVAVLMDAATYLAHDLGVDADELHDAAKDSEAVIRTALLVYSMQLHDMPDWPMFEKMIQHLRQQMASSLHTTASKKARNNKTLSIQWPNDLPPRFQEVVAELATSVEQDLPKIIESKISIRQLFDQTPAFMGRYFWLEDFIAEVENFERAVSKEWEKASAGRSDDASLLTLWLTMASASTLRTDLSEKQAKTLLRKIKKNNFSPEKVEAFIQDFAPLVHQQDYLKLWQDFVHEALPLFKSDQSFAEHDALQLLRRECNIIDK